MEYIKHWHDNFKILRLSMRLTQLQMAELLGVSQSLVNQLESCRRHFTESMLINIIEKCEIDIEEIVSRNESDHVEN